MSDGMSLDMQQEPEVGTPHCLQSFAAWIDVNHPPLPMLAGMLDLLGNELYRQGRTAEGNEVKHVVQELRGKL